MSHEDSKACKERAKSDRANAEQADLATARLRFELSAKRWDEMAVLAARAEASHLRRVREQETRTAQAAIAKQLSG